jgi:thioredoxin-like negative regulator of GroEL
VALFTVDAGNSLMTLKQYTAARTEFELAVAAQPERARAQAGLARSIVALGDKNEALHVLERARAAGISASDLRDALRNVPEMDALAADPRFHALLDDAGPERPFN